MIIYKWVFAHAISMSALCDFFLTGRRKKNKRKIQKKEVFIYALHFFVSLTFCTYLKRLTSVSGLTELFSRSAKILYSMYMYFYSYAYKYMSVICLLCPVFLCFLTCLKAARATNFWDVVCGCDSAVFKGGNVSLSLESVIQRPFWDLLLPAHSVI